MTTKQFAPPILLVFSAALLTACGGSDDKPASVSAQSAQQVCTQLNGANIGGATSVQAVTVAASGAVPTYCKVTGVLLPKLNFELRIPDAWNGKLYYFGGGGFDGSVPALAGQPLQALKDGYVGVASDSGHQGSVLDASWALNDSFAAELWGSLSVPTVMSTALEMVKAAYGQPPSKSYFEGCSNGGREGMMAMQRNPNLFDGVIVRSPAYNIVGFFGHWNLNNKALSAPGAALSNAKIATLAKAVRDQCDAADGIVDGVVSNQACTAAFNPQTLRCAGGADTGDSCLSDTQLAAISTVTSVQTFGSGQTVFHDAARPFTGNEDDPGAWPSWISGGGNVQTTISYLLTDSAIKYFIARDPTVNSLTYSPYDQDLNSLFAFSTLSDATNPDIRPFINGGGKVIFWKGGNDAAFATPATAEYYEAVVNALGGHATADNSVRFYVAPGVDHCSGGPGADSVDLLTPLNDWVLNSKAPGNLVASKLDASGAVQFQRALCQYPQYPRYTGPANDAAAAKIATNYTCTSP